MPVAMPRLTPVIRRVQKTGTSTNPVHRQSSECSLDGTQTGTHFPESSEDGRSAPDPVHRQVGRRTREHAATNLGGRTD